MKMAEDGMEMAMMVIRPPDRGGARCDSRGEAGHVAATLGH